MMGQRNQAGDNMPDIGWQVGIDIGGTFTDLVALQARDRRIALDQGADAAQ